jgi:hypothetical protein
MAVIATAVALHMPEPPERSYTPAADPLQGPDLVEAALERLEGASSHRVRATLHHGDGSGPYQDLPTETVHVLGVTSRWYTHTTDPAPAVLMETSGDGASPARLWADGTSLISWDPEADQWFHDDPGSGMDEASFFPVRTALAAIADHGRITGEDRAVFTPDPFLARGEDSAGAEDRSGVRLRGTLETAESTTEFAVFTTVKGTPLGLSTETAPTGAAWIDYREYEVVDLDAPVGLTAPDPDEIGPWQEAGGP